MRVWKARCVRPILAKHNRRQTGVHVPLQTRFLKFISSYVFLLLRVGGLGRKEGRKESKNLCFILGSHTPEPLFVCFVPAHLCIVNPVYVLRLSSSKPLLLLEGEFTVSYSSSSDCLSLLPVAQAPTSPSPSITEPFSELNQLTYLAETFFCWVSELNWCRISSNRHGGERECRCLQQEGGKY